MLNLKKICFVTLLFSISSFLSAQEFGVRLDFRVNKDWELADRLELSASQAVSARPTFKKAENELQDDFLDLFLFPGADDDDDDDNDDDDDDDDDDENNTPGSNNNGGEVLSDGGMAIELGLQSVSSLELTYDITEDLDVQAGYSLLLQPDRLRHGWETRLNYRLPFSTKKWRHSLRAGLQHSGEQKRRGFEINSGTVIGFRTQWRKSKTHIPYVGADVTGEWDEGQYELDRYRMEGGWSFRPKDNKNMLWRFAYRYQKRFGREGYSQDVRLGLTINLGGTSNARLDRL